MRGRHFLWRGGFTTVSAASLATFHAGAQALGLTAVGGPIFRPFGSGGIKAVGLYEQGHIIFHLTDDIVIIEGLFLGNFDWKELHSLAKATFGLKKVERETGTEYLTIQEGPVDL